MYLKRTFIGVIAAVAFVSAASMGALAASHDIETMDTLHEITQSTPTELAFGVLPDIDGDMLVLEFYAFDHTEPTDLRHLVRFALVFDQPVSDLLPANQINILTINRYRPPIE